ncbi:hypothetical protein V8G54_022161 [Vigna mungo]|uniref:Polyprotein n=1 Tax=Vigna mungo TaxID=3915 RepID=A0AAQ3NH20_VIGMU
MKKISVFAFWWILVLLGVLCCEGCWKHEKEALVNINSVYFEKNLPWADTTDCCKWDRVECNSTTGRVLKLDLTWDAYHGFWTLNYSHFLVFEDMRILKLSGNGISSCVETQALGLNNLEVLDLSRTFGTDDILSCVPESSSLKNILQAKLLFSASRLRYFALSHQLSDKTRLLEKTQTLGLELGRSKSFMFLILFKMTEEKPNPANNPTSLYYLHPRENPGLTLIFQILNETNYSSWSRSMRRALLSKNKVKFIDVSIKKPKRTEELFDSWERCNMMALSWIIRTLSPQIAESVIYVEEAKELWDELRERFSKGDYFKISDLLQDIHSIKQGEMSVNQFFTELKILWEELESLRPIPNCTCTVPCSCELSKISLKYREIEHIICFLKGLNDSYNTQERQERSGISHTQFAETTKVLATVNNKSNNWKGDQTWKNQGRGSGQGRGRGKNPNHGKQCSYCNKMNHTMDECYSKHGYPPWYKKTDGNSEVRGGWNSANVCQNISGLETDQKNSTSAALSSLTPEQMQKLLKMIEEADQPSHIINQMQSNNKEDDSGTLSWIIDTGATDHVTHEKESFVTFYKIKPITVRLPNNTIITANYAGTVQFSKDFVLFNVLYIPDFSFNLISVQSLTKDLNCSLTFSSRDCQIRENSTLKMIGGASSHKGLYYLQDFPCPDQNFVFKSVFSFKHVDINLWHYRLGHPGHKIVKQICELFPYVQINADTVCDVCHCAKQHKLPFPTNVSLSVEFFDLIHCDIWGPLSISSVHGHKYFLTIVDDYSQHTWIFLMNNKGQTRSLLQNFVIKIKNQFGKMIKTLRSHNGPEFNCANFYDSYGINHQTSCVETLEQNSVSNLPNAYLSYAASHAVYLINRLPSPILNGKTPHDLIYGAPPTYLSLKTFGCLCFASTLEGGRNKHEPRARKCVFLGYKSGVKGYTVLDIHTRELFVSRNVVFYEDIFPWKNQQNSTEDDNRESDKMTFLSDPIHSSVTGNGEGIVDRETEQNIDVHGDVEDLSSGSGEDPGPRRFDRVRNHPGYLDDYIHQVNQSLTLNNNLKTPYPISDLLSCESLTEKHLRYTMVVAVNSEPRSYKEAKDVYEWADAMQKEIKALEENNTWSMTELPPGKTAIGCRWVYKIKYRADGVVERHKARLEGIDFLDTFSPVAKLTTIRLLIALAASKNWFLHQLDVDNAFLHGDLNEEAYMEPPPELTNYKRGQVCRLTKFLYGLKQASRQWFEKLSTFLISVNYVQSKSDHSLFVKETGTSFTALLVCVDDVILAGNSMEEINHIKNLLHNKFRIKNLGELKYFLGLEVARSRKGIHLSQRKYALDILKETGMLGCKPCTTPFLSDMSSIYKQESYLADPSSYRRLIGKLLYLSNTRPDLCFSINLLSQFMQSPTGFHFWAVQHVLRYIKSKPSKGLFFPAGSPIHIKAFSDSDWATTVSRSSTEAEFRALAATTCEIQWLNYLLDDLQVKQVGTPALYCDNKSARHIAHNQSFHERTKHIELDCHVVREKIQANALRLLPVRSDQQLADIFTKFPHRVRFHYIVPKLELMTIHHPA